MDRCCHLVVEEGDCTLPMWHKHVGEIIVSWRKQRNKQESSSPDQLVMVAERWNSAVEQFTKTFIVESSSPVVVLANLLEAVIYERDRTKRIVICSKDMKTSNMLGLMVSELRENVTVNVRVHVNIQQMV